MMALKIRAIDNRIPPQEILYWGKDFFDLECRVFSKDGFPDTVDIRIGNSPQNKRFELHVLTNEFFRKDMPSCQGEVILEICTGKDKKGKEIWQEIGSFAQ
ncbi:MAG: hypothetical protein KAW52_00290 [candidate division Zixibacteria bacterium]|nr:hypothetical protein [candidate division Zixibacteria bacterium]